MEQRQIIHFVDPSSRMRAELSRLAYDLGHHAEVYSDGDELVADPPREGILVLRDSPACGEIGDIMDRLAQTGVWLPLIAAAENPQADRIVAAIKAGALDYLSLPLDSTNLANAIQRIGREAREHSVMRRRMIDARTRIANLSVREREVLDWLAEGSSNKLIARELEISPRTVEIHRANMMTKLGAKHSAEAVRMRIEAQIDGTQMAMRQPVAA
ncbi:Transcriptional regulatory protein FixJ [Alteripontixanthobacter maritimus]|uniref:Transcriptional regulatory protein FixJ n=1 Tax=Alteripontixanthobacter maritimus TaxID=2161824 RepID=A0A369QB65_9SPHN|nr:LuxR C-terminal-related transcriptional regulator [Alteripontixanthobacter maritimus]RDC59498.1 Transcriptional regulatory protein FixJ [Alteripontixanthobacter maritimus]